MATENRGEARTVTSAGDKRTPAKRTHIVALLLASGVTCVSAGALGGYLIARRGGEASSPPAAEAPAATVWTCSMHPQIQLPVPGKCPMCFMDLIPLEKDSGGDETPRRLKMSRAAAALAEVQTQRVQRKAAAHEVRLVGKVDYDETRLADITSWIPGGRLDRLYVDYTGITVRKGDHLFSIYSPELVAAQGELLLQSRAERSPQGTRGESSVRRSSELTVAKLRRWGLLDEQIEEIKRRGAPSDHVTVYAPIGGVVIKRHMNEGVYVQEGTAIYTIADLSRVWVYLDAYESDIPWLRFGQQVNFTTESYPGEVFSGRIAFIDPMLNEMTRTVKVRLNVPNQELRLKPGMFVRAVVQSRLAAGGRVLDAALAGKWISPMHPEIVKDGPGKCDICGIDLIPAEEYGFVASEEDAQPALVIPDSAPLITGKRAVVYVKLPDRDEPTFEGREVVLGHRAGNYYLVRGGLKEGEQVVTVGNFKIDSALQIRASPSMMSPDADATAGDDQVAEPLDVPSSFRVALAPLLRSYLRLQEALADDRMADAVVAWEATRETLPSIDPSGLDGRARQAWNATRQDLDQGLRIDLQRADIDQLRKQFEPLSTTMLGLVDVFGHAQETPLAKAFCPMAFGNRGAEWLQADGKIANPYFGHKMLRCGEIRRSFPAAGRHGDRPGPVREDGP